MWPLVVVGSVLLLAWAGPAVWWVATECRATCLPGSGTAQLRLSSGTTLPIVESTQGDTVYVDYLTRFMHDEARFCDEAREVLRALKANGRLAKARKVLMSPSDPRTRLLGTTWHGPVLTCCVSTGVIFRRSGELEWRVSSGPCKGAVAAQQGHEADETRASWRRLARQVWHH